MSDGSITVRLRFGIVVVALLSACIQAHATIIVHTNWDMVWDDVSGNPSEHEVQHGRQTDFLLNGKHVQLRTGDAIVTTSYGARINETWTDGHQANASIRLVRGKIIETILHQNAKEIVTVTTDGSRSCKVRDIILNRSGGKKMLVLGHEGYEHAENYTCSIETVP